MATENDSPAQPTHLEPSELGTKEYWDELYTREISNHASNPADTGTNWFDDSGAQDKVLEFLASRLPGGRAATSFLDLGTGNGELLFGLRDEGWAGRMLGVDYSERSVEFARRINATRQERFGDAAEADEGEEDGEGLDDDDDDDDNDNEAAPSREPVEFSQHDILSPPPSEDSVIRSGSQNEGWDVVLDKGTFDAISLSAATDDQGRRVNEGYRAAALGLVKNGGFFLITSCNWTEEELERWFAGDDGEVGNLEQGRFEVADRIKYRSFSFGGVKGQTISTVCFRKVGR